MTFQVSVEPGFGSIDDTIITGDYVQVCGERGVGINQAQVKINKGNHYIRRTATVTSPFSKQPDAAPQAVQPAVTPPADGQAAAPSNGTNTKKEPNWALRVFTFLCGRFL